VKRRRMSASWVALIRKPAFRHFSTHTTGGRPFYEAARHDTKFSYMLSLFVASQLFGSNTVYVIWSVRYPRRTVPVKQISSRPCLALWHHDRLPEVLSRHES